LRQLSANYNLSAQGFSVLWAVLDLLKRYGADPMLARMEEYKNNPDAESRRQIETACRSGLDLVEQMSSQLGSEAPIHGLTIHWKDISDSQLNDETPPNNADDQQPMKW
jgi:hypothetical protein